jgi:hypothetical protein
MDIITIRNLGESVKTSIRIRVATHGLYIWKKMRILKFIYQEYRQIFMTCNRLKKINEINIQDNRQDGAYTSIYTVNGVPQQFRKTNISDYYHRINSLLIGDMIPKEIECQLDVCRNLMLYGWYVYEFYTVASDKALSTLELGLRTICIKEWGGENRCRELKGENGKYRNGLACYIEYLKRKNIIQKVQCDKYNLIIFPSIRNSALHGSDHLLSFALAFPMLEAVIDILNVAYSRCGDITAM